MDIGSIFGQVDEVMKGLDGLTTSGEERAKARIAMFKVYGDLVTTVLNHEGKMVEHQTATIREETRSKSWMARNWRPILMLTFCWILFWNYGILPLARVWYPDLPILDLPQGAWTLLTIGVGGYVAGRSWENVSRITGAASPLQTGLFDKRQKRQKKEKENEQ